MKKGIKIILVIASIIIFLLGCCAVLWFCMLDPHRGIVQQYENSIDLDYVLTPDKAIKDLDVFYSTLKGRHPAWLEKSNQIVPLIDDIYTTEKNHLKELKKASKKTENQDTEEITVLDLWRVYSRMLSLLHDGHSLTWWQNDNHQFINDFSEMIFYGKPDFIDGVSFEKLFDTFKQFFSWETEEGAKQTFCNYLLSEHYLRLCNVDTSDGVVFTWNIDNKTVDYSYSFVNGKDIVYPEESAIIAAQQKRATQNPQGKDTSLSISGNYDEYSRLAQQANDYVWYYIDKEYDLATLRISSCNYEDHYIQVVNSFFDEVISNGINNIAVDLRGNGGGNSRVADEFLRHIDIDSYKLWDNAIRYGFILWKNENKIGINNKYPQTYNGNVYVLTDINSYSSAMDFAMLITDNDLGKIVGQASGNNPESYGDVLYFQLPETKLGFTVSFKKWYRVDRTKSGQFIEPDYPCNPEDALMETYRIISNY